MDILAPHFDLTTAPAHWYPSPAKLNLFLYITGQRSDGYHTLQTLFQFLNYGDWLRITPRAAPEITLSPSLDGVRDDQNLIIKAARLLQHETQCQQGAEILLQKNLPMGGGIGGGSSNAATALLVLNQLWSLHLPLSELAQLGLQLGADVPIFVHGQCAFAEGVGEIITPCQAPEQWFVVAKPKDTSIATAAIFADRTLPRNTPKRSMDACLHAPFGNNCEKVVCNHFAEVEQLLSWLLKYSKARLTGTGACVFAPFDQEAVARAVLNELPAQFSGFIARSCNRSPLHTLLAQRFMP
ncbi:4-(cytidine 5'-diphospho)-2-C-methyl-D-erythritol kinase [Pasteurellaceae bacterium HPA106]|uniref:4-(cytidine 5'-diphospho)-2-C-methyl-D-erythritol kinase n=1 Tax=Spirabiliibacterium pneumoniae TaxID=221400 RepID=UPI001AAD9B96|nr:4-(cytidine 5'-diphospho)-2-C-methyl-D-erythritol kinase [Spirabiliibacterium pneumoniae]MBE2896312.1 4-(cytidine 5'-diphospho)-2-C-methyl-D-erythritol kinase [Spirabiliibacterium pneumoniae]